MIAISFTFIFIRLQKYFAIPQVKTSFQSQQWAHFAAVVHRICSEALKKVRASLETTAVPEQAGHTSAAPPNSPKKSKLTAAAQGASVTSPTSAASSEASSSSSLLLAWTSLSAALSTFERRAQQITSAFTFSFVEGMLVKAFRSIFSRYYHYPGYLPFLFPF